MEQSELHCQRYLARVFGALPFIAAVVAVNTLWLRSISPALRVALLFGVVYIYYIFSGKLSLFRQTCPYEVVDGVVRLQKGKRTVTLGGVREVMMWRTSFLGTSMSHLTVSYAGGTLRLHSVALPKGASSASDFQALCETLCACEPALQKDISYSRNMDLVYRVQKGGDA